MRKKSSVSKFTATLSDLRNKQIFDNENLHQDYFIEIFKLINSIKSIFISFTLESLWQGRGGGNYFYYIYIFTKMFILNMIEF